jgi:Aspartyl protease
VLLAIALLATTPVLAGDCRVKHVATIDALESQTGGLLVPIQVGRHQTYLTLDTGGFANLLFEDVVAIEGLRTQASARAAIGASGGVLNRITTDHQRSYYVVPRGAGGDLRESGTLGAGYYQGSDLDIDFPARKIRLVPSTSCDGGIVTRVRPGRALPIRLDEYGRAFVTVTLDGKPLTALIDTGSSESTLDPAAARRLFQLSLADPSVSAAGTTVDAAGVSLPTYRRQFRRLDLGGIGFDSPWLALSANGLEPGVDLILGLRQLRRLHLYFAFGERKLYATAIAATPEVPPIPAAARPWPGCIATGPGSADVAIQGCSSIIAAATESRELIATAYSRRAAAYHRKAENAKALADFESALRIEPNFAYALYGRGLTRRAAGDAAGGAADIAAAQRMQPDIAERFAR